MSVLYFNTINPVCLCSESPFYSLFTAPNKCTSNCRSFHLALIVCSFHVPQSKLYFPFAHTSLLYFWLLRISICCQVTGASAVFCCTDVFIFNYPAEREMKEGESGGSCRTERLHCGAVCRYACIPIRDSVKDWKYGAEQEKLKECVTLYMHIGTGEWKSIRFQVHLWMYGFKSCIERKKKL